MSHKNRRHGLSPVSVSSRRAIEAMESRLFLSASSPTHFPILVSRGTSPLVGDPVRFATGSTSPGGLGLTAAQMRGAYGLGPVGNSAITFNGVQGDGTGQTMVVVDAYHDPTIATDLQTFDSAMGLANPPSFTVLSQTGTTTLPSNDVQNPSSQNDWAPEEALDVEWSHVMAPGAKIIVIECSSDLELGNLTAAAMSGVSVISNSWGSSESSDEASSEDPYFVTPSGHPGVTYFASTGDTGAEISYPAESPNVVAIGGTALSVSGTSWSSESTWSSGGGGTSAYESQPAYQAGTVSASRRETPDISLDASPSTGVPICDAWDYGTTTPWAGVYGGTSLSSPMAAGVVAVADQGRAAEGLTPLTSNQTLTRLYQMAKANFHDITTGSNGHAAVTGYDEATGIGTPIGNVLIPNLAGTGTITGRDFIDNAGNGVYGGTDSPVAGQSIYLDLNNDGVLDNSEPSTTTNAQGIYTFTDQPAGGSIRLTSAAPTGYALSSPSSAAMVYGATQTVNFTFQATGATNLAFAQQPSASKVGATLSPVVVNLDSASNAIVTTNATVVTLTLSSGSFSTGSNTLTTNAVNGVATFNSLQINLAGTYTITATDGTLTSATSTSFVISKATPTVAWNSPGSIAYGTALSSTQLNATASVPGNFVYTPAAGAVLSAGANQPLNAVFTPTDTTDYTTANASTTITVTAAAVNLSGSDFYLKRDQGNSANLDVWTNATGTGAPSQAIPFASISSITLTGNSFVADFSNGSVVPSGGLTVNGAGPASGNSLIIVGTGGNDAVIAPPAGPVLLNGISVASTDVGNIYFRSPGAGEALTVSAGNLTLAPNTGSGIGREVFSSITIGSGAQLLVPSATGQANRLLVQTAGLTIAGAAGRWTGLLDLANNDLDVSGGSLSVLSSQIAQGDLSATGGIISSTALSQPQGLVTLGVIQNTDNASTGPLYGTSAPLGAFDGANPSSSAVLIKFTYFGDANLDGKVDGTDYALLDNGFLNHLSNWYNGDFNLDGALDGSDYTLIDNAFNQQGSSLAAQVAASVASTQKGSVAKLNVFSSAPVTAVPSLIQANDSWKQKDVATDILG